MCIESKAKSLNGPARIGHVTFSRTMRTLHYRGCSYLSLNGSGFKANYFDTETNERFWISGPRRDGQGRLYVTNLPVHIDDDVREEYWTKIRKQPERKDERQT